MQIHGSMDHIHTEQKQFHVNTHHSTNLNIMDENLSESSWQHVSGLWVATITNVGHQVLALETAPDPVVNTFGFAPVPLQQKTEQNLNNVHIKNLIWNREVS